MGYDVHIARKKAWSDESGPRITEDEWRACVAADPELLITGSAECKTPQGEIIKLSQPLLTEWRNHSNRSPVWISYSRSTGTLTIKNPDEECLEKMRDMAAMLQGDEGEFYDQE